MLVQLIAADAKGLAGNVGEIGNVVSLRCWNERFRRHSSPDALPPLCSHKSTATEPVWSDCMLSSARELLILSRVCARLSSRGPRRESWGFWISGWGPQRDLPERDSPTQSMRWRISAGVADEPKLNLRFRSYSGPGFHDVDPMRTRRWLHLGSMVHGGR